MFKWLSIVLVSWLLLSCESKQIASNDNDTYVNWHDPAAFAFQIQFKEFSWEPIEIDANRSLYTQNLLTDDSVKCMIIRCSVKNLSNQTCEFNEYNCPELNDNMFQVNPTYVLHSRCQLDDFYFVSGPKTIKLLPDASYQTTLAIRPAQDSNWTNPVSVCFYPACATVSRDSSSQTCLYKSNTITPSDFNRD